MGDMISYYKSLDEILDRIKEFILADLHITFTFLKAQGKCMMTLNEIYYRRAMKLFPDLCTEKPGKYGNTLYFKIGDQHKGAVELFDKPNMAEKKKAPAKAPAKGRKKNVK